MQGVKQVFIQTSIVLKYKLKLFKLLRDQITLCEYGIAIDDVIIPFDVKHKVIHDEAHFVEVVFYHKGHVREGETDEVSEDYPVVS